MTWGAAKAGADNVALYPKLKKSLASEAQMLEPGVTIAGTGSRYVFRDAPCVVGLYGGALEDWVKKSSTQYTDQLVRFETHWVENIRTGQRVEFKVKINPYGES